MRRTFTATILLFIFLGARSQALKHNPPVKHTPQPHTGSSAAKKLPLANALNSSSNDKSDSSEPTLTPKRAAGQWRGSFVDNSNILGGYKVDAIDYVLELECSGNNITGYSYTYFYEGSKRFYTICKLRGKLYPLNKQIVITEYERTRFNTPPEFRNCFQTHRLNYSQDDPDQEELKGEWMPAPNQEGTCGYGYTTLSRKIVHRTPIVEPTAKAKPKTPAVRQGVKPRQKPGSVTVGRTAKPRVNPSPKPKEKPPVTIPDEAAHNPLPESSQENKAETVITPREYEKRTNTVEKSIDIRNETVQVEFYDNGEIDGDSISVYFNGKLIVSHLRLSDKPATFTLTLDKDRDYNELIMYAENLGTIPPNTALMVVKDGDNQHEVHITSDTEKNGTIYFHYQGKH